MSQQLDRYLAVGMIRREHGIKGEVKLSPLTDSMNRLKKLKKCYIERNGIYEKLNVVSVRFSDDEAIVLFEECKDRDEAAKLRNTLLYVEREDAAKPEKGRYFLCDLEKCSVSAGGEIIADVEEVVRTGANDVLSCRLKDGRNLMIPFVKPAIDHIDMDEQMIYLSEKAMEEMAVINEN